MAENSYVKVLINGKAHTSDDLQWKRGPTSLNEPFVSFLVSDLNTSMREEPGRITTTITEPLIQYVRARAGKLHLKGFSHPMTLVLGLLLLTHDARCCRFSK